MRVGIIGMGLGGATLALALHLRGVEAVVFEQAGQIREVGAGIAVWPNSVRLLARAGLGGEMARIGARMIQPRVMTRDGAVLHGMAHVTADGTPGYYMHRAEFLDVISAPLPPAMIRLGRRCTGVVQDEESVTARFEDGGFERFDVLIGADGIRSSVAGALAGDLAPTYANLAAYRGLVPNDADQPLATGNLWTDRRKYFVAFPVSGGRRVNFVGVIPTDGDREENWFKSGDKADLARAFADWDPVLRDIIARVDETFLWGLYKRRTLESYVDRRIVLIGDAAHPMMIHAGQGVGQAVEDAFALAVFLEDATPEALPARLAAYDALRVPRATAVQDASRRNAQFLHADFPLDPGVPRPDRTSPVDWIIDYDAEREAEHALAHCLKAGAAR